MSYVGAGAWQVVPTGADVSEADCLGRVRRANLHGRLFVDWRLSRQLVRLRAQGAVLLVGSATGLANGGGWWAVGGLQGRTSGVMPGA